MALLHSYDAGLGLTANPEVSLIPILDTREVEAVFTAPFQDFLRGHGENGEDWYRGSWGMWHNSEWRSKYPPMYVLYVSMRWVCCVGLPSG